MADERTRLAEAIVCTVTGPVWHGESLSVLLAGVTAADAASHPIDHAHSVWELVLHLTSWVTIVQTRLSLEAIPETSDDEDWPTIPAPTPRNWTLARQRLLTSHEALAAKVRTLSPRALNAIVPTRAYTVRTMLHGIPEHGAYHGGQIALLRKLFE